MSFLKQSSLKIRILYTFLFISAAADIIASDHFITGTVTDINGAIVSGARILMTTNYRLCSHNGQRRHLFSKDLRYL